MNDDLIAHSETRLAAILGRIEAQQAEYGIPNAIPVTAYENPDTFNFLLPNAGWNFFEWQQCNEYVIAGLRKRGYNAVPVELKLTEYWDWIEQENMDNTPQARAMFASMKMAEQQQ